jgi:hypothetical protein
MKKIFLSLILVFNMVFAQNVSTPLSTLLNDLKNKTHKMTYFYIHVGSVYFLVNKNANGVSIWNFTNQKEWRPVHNVQAFDGYDAASESFDNINFDFANGTISIGNIIANANELTSLIANKTLEISHYFWNENNRSYLLAKLGDYLSIYHLTIEKQWQPVYNASNSLNKVGQTFTSISFDQATLELKIGDVVNKDISSLPAPFSTQDLVEKVGFFIDNIMSGLPYICDSAVGVTGEDGSFSYNNGDSCTFYLGENEYTLDNVVDQDVVTPFDLTGSEEEGLALSRVLQSLSVENADGSLKLDQNRLRQMKKLYLNDVDKVEEAIKATGAKVKNMEEVKSHLEKAFEKDANGKFKIKENIKERTKEKAQEKEAEKKAHREEEMKQHQRKNSDSSEEAKEMKKQQYGENTEHSEEAKEMKKQQYGENAEHSEEAKEMKKQQYGENAEHSEEAKEMKKHDRRGSGSNSKRK